MNWRIFWPGGGRARASRWDGIDYLDLVPSRAVAFEERADGGHVVLLVPRYRDPVWGRIIQPRLGPRKRFVRVPLEARGSALWRAMDGQRPVRDLIAAVRSSAPADEEDLPRRVCLYLQNLVENRFVTLSGWPDSEPAADSAKL